ncbi:MAG: PKD domain-containing protein [Bacteroidales bacterium]
MEFTGSANTNSSAFFPNDSLKWDFEDDGIWDATGWNVSYTYPTSGNYTVRFKASNNLGCFDDDTETIEVIVGPDASFTADNVCLGEEMSFTNTSTLNGSNAFTQFFWDFENDGTWDAFTENPGHIYTTAGTFDVKFKIVTDLGCMDSIVSPVTVNLLPVADFTFNSQCPDVMIQFNDASVPNANGELTYFWDFGGFTSTDQILNICLQRMVPMMFLQVTNANGCSHDTTKQILIEKPTAAFAFDVVCFGQTTFFTNESTFDTSPIINWDWDFGDGSGTSVIQNPNYTYSNHGLYDVVLTVENELGCFDDSIVPVLVDTLPVAAFSHTATCVGMQTCFTDESIANADTINSWIWNFGDGNISTLKDPCHEFNNIGNYTVTLVVINSDGCSSVPYIEEIYVAGQPEAAFSAVTSCFGDTTYFVNLTDSANTEISSWMWDFGDPGSMGNNSSVLFEPSHLFSTPGPFQVSLSVENIYGCNDMVQQTITIDSLPEAMYVMPDTVALSIPVTFNDNSVGHGSPVINRMWDFGDGTSANNINPVIHTYDTAGVYEICLTVFDFNGCSDIYCDSIVITDFPEANFTYASDVTLESFFFDESQPSNTIIDWYWDFGDPTTSLDTATGTATPTWIYPAEGWYEVYLKVWDRFGGYDDITQMVYAGNAVIADFQHQFVCLGDTTMFLDNSYSPISAGFEDWYWDFGDRTDSTYYSPHDTILHRYMFPGVYNVKFGLSATVYGYFMTDTMYQTLEVFEYPFARVDTAGLGVCFGQEIQFNDASIYVPNDPGVEWKWDFGDGTIENMQNPVHMFADTGEFKVSLQITSLHGCSTTDTTPAYVNFAPDFEFLIKNPCLNNAATFIPDYDSTKLEITQWHWNFGDYLSDDNTSTVSHPQHTYSRIDNYTVTMKMKAHGCSGETQQSFLVYPVPFSDYKISTDYGGVQGRVKFTNNSIFATHYLWDFGNGNTSTVPDPVGVYEYDSTYSVTLVSYNDYPPNTTDDFKCSDTTIHKIKIFFRGLYFPTAFSPNNPNDEISHFTPKGVNLETYEVQVFDLKGNLMWESDELDEHGTPAESWDGYNPDGVLMPQGMYIWKAAGRFKDGTVWTGQSFDDKIDPKTNGVVTLVR